MLNKRGMLGEIIGAFVIILVGITLLPIISQQLDIAKLQMNTTGTSTAWSESVLDLVPAMFAIAILGVGVMVGASALRSAGLFGGGNRDEGEYETEDEETVRVLKKGNVREEDYELEKKKEKSISTKEQNFKKIQEEKYKKMDQEINKIYKESSGENINKQMDKQIESDSNGSEGKGIEDTKKFEQKNKNEVKGKYD